MIKFIVADHEATLHAKKLEASKSVHLLSFIEETFLTDRCCETSLGKLSQNSSRNSSTKQFDKIVGQNTSTKLLNKTVLQNNSTKSTTKSRVVFVKKEENIKSESHGIRYLLIVFHETATVKFL